jgi:hypothetical protein
VDLPDFEVKNDVGIVRIFVSWTEEWDLSRYVDNYLQTRNYYVTDEARATIGRFLALYPGTGPYRKADVDYYLDANAEGKLGTSLVSRPVK